MPPKQQLLLAFDPQTSAFASDALTGSLRRVVIGNEIIGYRLQRARRRSIGFQINERGLTIRAPRWITLREIETAIIEHQGWIRSRQIKWLAWCDEHRRAAIRFADGGHVKYLGKTATLRLCAEAGATHYDGAAEEIRLALSNDAAEVHVREALQVWLQAQARGVLAERLERFAGRIDSRFAGWRLSSARTQWGSCSHDGRIRLSWRLVHFSLPVIDYVIAHELAHLCELNHGARFWKAVAHLLPGFETARDQIKRVEIQTISF